MLAGSVNVANTHQVRFQRSALSVMQVQQLAEKYFGGWQSMSSLPQAGLVTPDEPLPRPQGASRHFEQGSKAGPLLMQAYYRPSMTSKDAVLLDIIW